VGAGRRGNFWNLGRKRRKFQKVGKKSREIAWYLKVVGSASPWKAAQWHKGNAFKKSVVHRREKKQKGSNSPPKGRIRDIRKGTVKREEGGEKTSRSLKNERKMKKNPPKEEDQVSQDNVSWGRTEPTGQGSRASKGGICMVTCKSFGKKKFGWG